VLEANTTPLSPPKQRRTFLVPDDERKADAVLGQLRIEESQSKPQSRGLKRAFTKAQKSSEHTYKEVYAALSRVIEENGLAGVFEVLLKRFKTVGGDINLSRKASTGMVKRMTNADNKSERGRLLHMATEICRLDFVQLLAPLADQPSLDESLHIALENRELAIIETLLEYGE